MDSADHLYNQKNYGEADGAYRAWLTQYVIWYNEHTIPLVKDRPVEADALLIIDIEAVVSLLYFIMRCLYLQGKTKEIDVLLAGASDIIDDPR